MKLDLKVIYPKVEQNSREKDRMELTCIIEARNNAASTTAYARLGDFWMREEEGKESACAKSHNCPLPWAFFNVLMLHLTKLFLTFSLSEMPR